MKIDLNDSRFYSFYSIVKNVSGPSDWSDIGGTPESLWTPSATKNDDGGYWFRLQVRVALKLRHYKLR